MLFPIHTLPKAHPFVITHDNFSQPYQEFHTIDIIGDETQSYKEAMKNDD